MLPTKLASATFPFSSTGNDLSPTIVKLNVGKPTSPFITLVKFCVIEVPVVPSPTTDPSAFLACIV